MFSNVKARNLSDLVLATAATVNHSHVVKTLTIDLYDAGSEKSENINF